MPDLLCLDCRCNPSPVPLWLQEVVSPLKLTAWTRELADHPDEEFRAYILSGIAQGFRIGYDYSLGSCKPATSNMRSACENSEVVQAYLDKEVALGRVVGPVKVQDSPPGTQYSPIGVIPKSGLPGRWRLIVDHSSPEGSSVNDGIEPELCSMQYLRMDDVVRQIGHLGAGTALAKMDIESAYRNIPVHPSDRPLLGMAWRGQFFFDTRLPFGLRSAPKIFSAVADALQWCCNNNGVSWVAHYLDDFITVGAPDTEECKFNLEAMLALCHSMGVPIAPAKCVGPSTTLTFLGFELDTVSMIVRLPTEKLCRTKELVGEWVEKKACKKHDLESLLGHLQHAATVVRPGRTFVQRLIELLSRVKKPYRWIRISATTRSDLQWWRQFMEDWNGVALMPQVSQPTVSIESDASGSWGCGARWDSQWLQWKWCGQAPEWPISPKELLPILFSVAVWGHWWSGQQVVCHCDNIHVGQTEVPGVLYPV